VTSPYTYGTAVRPEPTTLSGRAAARLEHGPLDAITLMCDVCRVRRLEQDAADRMAVALLGHREEFIKLPSGHWALREASPTYSTERTSLADVSFAVVDVETTGARVMGGDRVTEIAIARVCNGKLADVYVQLVNPERPIPTAISALTHITWGMVKDQPTFGGIASDVSERLSGNVFTAHNANFDWRFVSMELSRSVNYELRGPRLCTVRMARALLPRLSRRSLDHIARYFGIDIINRHRAGDDAIGTAKALLRMLDVAGDRGIDCWEALQALVVTPAPRRMTRRGRRRAMPAPASVDHIA
jgi:DNA polymerase-3 subunit epsilon